jgi:hypothetical protein
MPCLNAKVRDVYHRDRIICPNSYNSAEGRVAQHFGDFQNWQRTFQSARIYKFIHAQGVPHGDTKVHQFETGFERIETRFNGDVTVCRVTRRVEPVKTIPCLKPKPFS